MTVGKVVMIGIGVGLAAAVVVYLTKREMDRRYHMEEACNAIWSEDENIITDTFTFRELKAWFIEQKNNSFKNPAVEFAILNPALQDDNIRGYVQNLTVQMDIGEGHRNCLLQAMYDTEKNEVVRMRAVFYREVEDKLSTILTEGEIFTGESGIMFIENSSSKENESVEMK